MCSSLFGLRNQTLSPSSTSGRCSVSESCTSLSCTLTVVYSGFRIPLSLETTLLPCSDPYGVHLLITSLLLGEVINDTFTQSRNFTISVLGSNADVIVDIKQQCYGLTLSVSCCYFNPLLLFTITVLFTSLRLGFPFREMCWSSCHQLTYTCSAPHLQVCSCHCHPDLMVTIRTYNIIAVTDDMYLYTYVWECANCPLLSQ